MTMKLPRYWVRTIVDINGDSTESPDGFWAFGWSDVSKEDARHRGQQRARNIAARYKNEMLSDDGYPYPDRPVCEEVVERHEAQGWAITRNGYGSLVLNTNAVMFVDIDLTSKPKPGFWNRLLNRRQQQEVGPVIENTKQITASIPGLGCRLYRTAAGLRLLVTSQTQDPASDGTRDLLGAFGSDSRYVLLCKIQESFRARLTPKPWRCKCDRPPFHFPYEKPEHLEKHARWIEQYNHKSQSFGVCVFIEHLGNPQVQPQIAPLVTLHDQYTLGPQDKPLA